MSFAVESLHVTSMQLIPRGRSVRFHGSPDYLSHVADTNLTFGSGDFTIECWVKNVGGPYTFGGRIGSTSNNTIGGWAIGINRSNGGPMGVLFIHNQSIVAYTSGYISSNVWHHIAVTRASGTLRIFIDGAKIAEVTYNTEDSALGPFCIGSSDALPDTWINAYLYDFRFVKGTALYTTTFQPDKLPLGNATGTQMLTLIGTTITDLSNNHFVLTSHGAPTITTVLP